MISFKDRITHTIAQLEAETQQGLEDWTTTIAKCRDLLKELEQEEQLLRSVGEHEAADLRAGTAVVA